MRTPFLLPSLVLAFPAFSQCDHSPTISPQQPIMCPNTTMELSTQQYDAYQWYMDGSPIQGATAQTFVVDYWMHSGYSFSVEATLNGCTEMSPSELVDGWAFLPPFVMQGGDEPYMVDENGIPHHCVGDTVVLSLGMPWTTNITWTDDWAVIPGENSMDLIVTTSGAYSAVAAPELCPNYMQPLGLQVVIQFTDSVQPVIELVNGTELCADPAGLTHTWTLNGNLIPGATGSCIPFTEAGAYMVTANYGHPCSSPSEPFMVTGLGDEVVADMPMLHPNPATHFLHVSGVAPQGKALSWAIVDAAGREVAAGRSAASGPWTIDVSSLPNGSYALRITDDGFLLPAARFVVAH